MQQYMVARQIEKIDVFRRIRAPVPVLLQPCSRGSRLFQEKERQKSPGRPAWRGPVPPKSLLAG